MVINVKMPTIVGILKCITRKNVIVDYSEQDYCFMCFCFFIFMKKNS